MSVEKSYGHVGALSVELWPFYCDVRILVPTLILNRRNTEINIHKVHLHSAADARILCTKVITLYIYFTDAHQKYTSPIITILLQAPETLVTDTNMFLNALADFFQFTWAIHLYFDAGARMKTRRVDEHVTGAQKKCPTTNKIM